MQTYKAYTTMYIYSINYYTISLPFSLYFDSLSCITTGSPAPPSVKHDWLLPAARLFAKMHYPQLEDRSLRQLLFTIYRNKYAPKPPPSVPSANVYKNSVPPTVGPSGINGSNYQNSSYYSNMNSSSNPLMGNSYRPPEINITSKQEQVLFMRWLNIQFDAQRKLAPPQQPTVTTAPPAVTGTLFYIVTLFFLDIVFTFLLQFLQSP